LAPSKRNNDESGELFLGIAFGIIAIVMLLVAFKSGDFSFLFGTSGSPRSGGVPNIFMVVLGLVAFYYAVKKILKNK